MSFYLGKDRGGSNVLHIASGKHTKSELQSGVIPDTVFHTDIDYCHAEVFQLSNLTRTNNGYYDITSGRLSNSAVDYISSRFTGNLVPIILVVKNGTIIFDREEIFNSRTFKGDYLDTGTPPRSSYVSHYTDKPSYTNRFIWLSGNCTSITLIVTSLSYNKVTNTIVTPNRLFQSGTSIKMSKSGIVVKGTNIGSIHYLTFKDVKSLNTFSGDVGNASLSVINYNNNNTSVELTARSNDVTLRNEFGEVIFDTELGAVFTTESLPVVYSYLTGGPNTPDSTMVINNIVASPGTPYIFITHIGASYYGAEYDRTWNGVYVGESAYRVLYTIDTSASGTTYEFAIRVQEILGVKRFVVRRRIIWIGSDGDPGRLLEPFMKNILTLQ